MYLARRLCNPARLCSCLAVAVLRVGVSCVVQACGQQVQDQEDLDDLFLLLRWCTQSSPKGRTLQLTFLLQFEPCISLGVAEGSPIFPLLGLFALLQLWGSGVR